MSVGRTILVAGVSLLSGCDTGGQSRCGPSTAIVERVVDGDTVVLDSGERVRYLLIDTPEIDEAECYAEEAKARNESLVLGKEIRLTYDQECTDRFDRLLAYIEVDGVQVNEQLIADGYACVLFISPNGSDRKAAFDSLETTARSESRGLWTCEESPC